MELVEEGSLLEEEQSATDQLEEEEQRAADQPELPEEG